MTTSGTYSSTTMNTSKIIDHAVRRCKLNPTVLTPESLRSARESLWTMLLALASDGLNLWAVQRIFMGLVRGQATYVLPTGTLDLLNLTYSIVYQVSGTVTTTSQSMTQTLESATSVPRVGVQFDTIPDNEAIVFEYSPDGISWTPFQTDQQASWGTETLYWYEPSITPSGLAFRVRSATNPITVNQLVLASSVSDISLTPFNRDDYMNLPNKRTSGTPTNYFLEKLINPQVTLWSVPNNPLNHLYGTIHRQVQEVGSLVQELQIPVRWQEAIIWNLAEILSWELPDVDASIIPGIANKAALAFAQVQRDETDGAPMRIMPNLRRYSR